MPEGSAPPPPRVLCSWLRWGLVIAGRKVTEGVALAASVRSVGDEQVVKPGQEHEDANNQNRNGPVGAHFADVARQQEAAHDNEKGTNQKLRGGPGNGLIRNLSRASLKL